MATATVDGLEIWRSPVEVGRLSQKKTEFFYIPQGGPLLVINEVITLINGLIIG